VTDANSRVAETSQASREIAADIVSVDQAAAEMASGSGHVRTNAGELSTVAESLRLTIAHFHT
jgi:methyl-accepting chemotaxis protein